MSDRFLDILFTSENSPIVLPFCNLSSTLLCRQKYCLEDQVNDIGKAIAVTSSRKEPTL